MTSHQQKNHDLMLALEAGGAIYWFPKGKLLLLLTSAGELSKVQPEEHWFMVKKSQGVIRPLVEAAADLFLAGHGECWSLPQFSPVP